MRTGTLVFSLTAAGLLGGLAGALLAPRSGPEAGPGPRPEPEPARSSGAAGGDPGRDLAALRNRVEALEANLSAANAEAARLRGRLEAQGEELRTARERIEEVATAGPPAGAVSTAAIPGGFVRLGEAGVVGASGVAVEAARESLERIRKALELRALSEEERWQKAREDVGLTVYQEEELKAAIKERNEARRAALDVTDAKIEGGDPSIVIRMPDREKMREATRKYEDRVNGALNAEQAKKWRDGGYETALGGGGARSAFIATSISTSSER